MESMCEIALNFLSTYPNLLNIRFVVKCDFLGWLTFLWRAWWPITGNENHWPQNTSQKGNHCFDGLSMYFTKGSIFLVEDESRGFGRISNSVKQPGRLKKKRLANPLQIRSTKKYPGWQLLQKYLQESSDKFWIINPVASIAKAAPGSMRRHQPLQKFLVKSVFAWFDQQSLSPFELIFSAKPPSLTHRPRGALVLACPEKNQQAKQPRSLVTSEKPRKKSWKSI